MSGDVQRPGGSQINRSRNSFSLPQIPPSSSGHCRVPVRHIIVGLLCLGAFTSTLSRGNMSTTIISMAPQRSINISSNKDSNLDMVILIDKSVNANTSKDKSFCGYDQVAQQTLANAKSEFDWSETEQDHLKGAFFIGYGVWLIPSGRLSEQYSGKLVALVGGVLHTSLNLITPWAARQSYWFLFSARVVLGMAGAAMVPAFFCIIARWIPDNEKSKAIAACSVGNSLANICLNLVSGFLCQYGIDGGWPSVFYLSGLLNLVWLVMWFLVASNHPSKHHFISKNELLHIGRNTSQKNPTPPPVTFWLFLRMFASVPVLATIFVKLAHSWYFNVLQTKVPQYMLAVLGMDLEQTSIWNTMFHVVMFVTTLISGCLADFVINQNCNKNRVRKTFESVSAIGMSLFMALLAQCDCNRNLFVIVMASSVAFAGISTGGSSTIVVDMTSDYAGTLIAIMSTITMLFGFGVPHLVTIIVGGHSESIHPWNRVFYASAIIQAIGGLVFLFFASAENQDWEKSQTQKSRSTNGVKNGQIYENSNLHYCESNSLTERTDNCYTETS